MRALCLFLKMHKFLMKHTIHWTVLPCKAKREYLLVCKISRTEYTSCYLAYVTFVSVISSERQVDGYRVLPGKIRLCQLVHIREHDFCHIKLIYLLHFDSVIYTCYCYYYFSNHDNRRKTQIHKINPTIVYLFTSRYFVFPEAR